jgi:hypothetical protein
MNRRTDLHYHDQVVFDVERLMDRGLPFVHPIQQPPLLNEGMIRRFAPAYLFSIHHKE